MSTNQTPPNWAKDAVATIKGWAHPKTGEILVSRYGLLDDSAPAPKKAPEVKKAPEPVAAPVVEEPAAPVVAEAAPVVAEVAPVAAPTVDHTSDKPASSKTVAGRAHANDDEK